MGRWEPNALQRLQQAAMALFLERGYTRTTVGEIAARAQLTERTFFRYFTDKREVLFSGSKDFEKFVVESIASTPKTTPPLDAVLAAFEATTPFFAERRAYARRRQALIERHAELRERELIKFAELASIIAGKLRGRGLSKSTATLVAETGVAVFQNAFERWVGSTGKKQDLTDHIRAALADLRLVAAETVPRPVPARTTSVVVSGVSTIASATMTSSSLIRREPETGSLMTRPPRPALARRRPRGRTLP
jgi:AcrR family transcriptional regulator